jgi:hypothetical protein
MVISPTSSSSNAYARIIPFFGFLILVGFGRMLMFFWIIAGKKYK